jgi:hypothetical protein
MSSDPQQPPFQRKQTIREPGIVGAQWWNDGLTAMGDPVSRRSALKSLAAIAGTVAVGGFLVSQCGDSGPSGSYASGSSERLEYFDALQMQKARGWDFGAGDERLAFSGGENTSSHPHLAQALAAPEQLVTELTPRQDGLKPFYQATLFQALAQQPPGVAGEPSTALRNSLRPLLPQEMLNAYRKGQALAELFEREDDTTTAVMVDLPGPESVAFAAGMARRFEPVFTFDNWPHPLGVVPAHLTLAAVAYFREPFRRLAQERRSPAPPVFVLDRNRLAPFNSPTTQFDNRYVARLPPAESLLGLGLKHVLYVVPGELKELDDLNEDFAAYRTAGVDVRLVATGDFRPEPAEFAVAQATQRSAKMDESQLLARELAALPPASGSLSGSDGGVTLDGGVDAGGASVAQAHSGGRIVGVGRTDGVATGSGDAGVGATVPGGAGTPEAAALARPPRYYFGGSPMAHALFWSLYPWGRTPGAQVSPESPPFSTSGGHRYTPQARATMFTGVPHAAASSAVRPRPGNNFGMVMMRVAGASAAILGPGFGPRSSWNRSSGSSYGG